MTTKQSPIRSGYDAKTTALEAEPLRPGKDRMRSSMSLPLVLPLALLVGFAACSGKGKNDLAPGAGDDAGGDATTQPSSDDGGGSGPTSSGGTFAAGEGGGPQATDCKGGHYSGTFTGNYTSYLTSLFGLGGIPLMVTGDVEMDLQETMTMTQGEIAMTTFNIANGTISGFANSVFPYHCDMVGTLDCNAKKIVGGGLRNCWYCVGLFVSLDGGNCGTFGHFEGPLDANYDGKTFSFVNGSWQGSEEAATGDGGLVLGDGGGVNDAGLYVGPGNYGGAGNWQATYSADY